jgi:hypothetical protein
MDNGRFYLEHPIQLVSEHTYQPQAAPWALVHPSPRLAEVSPTSRGCGEAMLSSKQRAMFRTGGRPWSACRIFLTCISMLSFPNCPFRQAVRIQGVS